MKNSLFVCLFFILYYFYRSLINVKSIKLYRNERGETDLSQYTLENIMGETVVRTPGSIPGRPYSISNCLKSNIFLFDHLDAVNVSDCKDCTLYLGPTKGR